jgi:prevent-host-death family protein
MNSVGLFEAKTKLSEICRKVSEAGQGVVITHRGKPLVRIEPIQAAKRKKSSVWEARAAYIKKHGLWKDDFELPPKEKQTWRNPLDD